MSAPRAGRSGGFGRGRGGGSRSGSPQVGAQHGQRSLSPNPWGGQQNVGIGRARGGGNIRARATTRGRGNAGQGAPGAQRGLKSSLKTQSGPARGAKSKDMSRHVTFAFTGDREWRSPENATRKDYKSRISSLWDSMKRERVAERQAAIREGKMSDPEKKIKLSEAIRPVGECEEMCSEWERITRIHDGNVLGPEKTTLESGERVPDEEKMVKRFQRSAAGDEEQLPSDLRPPRVLLRTLNYMVDGILDKADCLADIQDFFWDRSRAIRNDFSIQQVTGVEDVEIAAECFERITRYHIYALHDTAQPSRSPKVEHKQENEQLTNTLTSLFQYYDDNRGRVDFENEPEFRAYFIIREIGQQMRPDLESRVQHWPVGIIKHPRVQAALRLYAAASDVTLPVGPLDPRQAIVLAQANGVRFWSTVNSAATSYLMACCAETYFRLIRDTTLTTIWKCYKRPTKAKIDDMLLSDLVDSLGFGNEEEAQEYCQGKGFVIGERDDGNAFLDLNSLSAGLQQLPISDRVAIQAYSGRLVEDKRHDRSAAAIIKGLSVADARTQGLLETSINVDMEAEQDAPEPASNTSLAPVNVFASGAPAAGRNLFGQPSAAPVNAFSAFQPKVSNAITPQQPNHAANNSHASFPNPFAPFAPNQQNDTASNRQTPLLSNQQIASKLFNTPSQSLFANKAPESSSGTAIQAGSGLPSGSLSLEGTQSPFAQQSKAVLNSTPSESNTPSQSIFGAPPTTGLGSTLFPKAKAALPKQSEEDVGTGANPVADTEPESLFIPDTTPKPSIASATSERALNTASGPGSGQQISSSVFPAVFQHTTNSQDTFAPSRPDEHNPGAAEPFSGFSEPQTNASVLSSPKPNISNPAPTPSGLANGARVNPFAKPTGSSAVPSNLNSSQTLFSGGAQVFLPTPSAQTNEILPTTFSANPSSAPVLFRREQNISDAHGKPIISTAPSGPKSSPRLAPEQGPVASARSAAKRPTKDESLEKLARAFVLGPDGMIQQFLENEIAETVRSCMKKVNREREKEQAASARRFLLSRKYAQRWRDLAWKKKLRKSARQRREEFRKSLQEMALSSRASSRAGSETPATKASAPPTTISPAVEPKIERPSNKPSMPPPPPKSIVKSSHQGTLPQQSTLPDMPRRMFGGSVDRLRSKAILLPPTRWSKTSSALSPVNKDKVNKNSRFGGRSTSTMGRSGAVDEQMMKQASRLIDGRTDTTRTDYFKLKALGLDPKTPAIPQTRKRPSDHEIESAARKSRLSPAKMFSVPSELPRANGAIKSSIRGHSASDSIAIPKAPASAEDDDELFAQIKEVRNALSETESWYREYREQSERTSVDLANETEKQRKLREWKPSVSRTQARWKRDGLPSFLRSSYTPRDTVSAERLDVRLARHDEFVNGSEAEEEEDFDECAENSVEGGRDLEVEHEDDEDDFDEEGEETEREEEEEEGEEEEYYDDDYDTPALGSALGNVVRAGSAFASQGASIEDAIEL